MAMETIMGGTKEQLALCTPRHAPCFLVLRLDMLQVLYCNMLCDNETTKNDHLTPM